MSKAKWVGSYTSVAQDQLVQRVMDYVANLVSDGDESEAFDAIQDIAEELDRVAGRLRAALEAAEEAGR